MTDEQFDAAHRAFRRRQPFSAFLIEFTSDSAVGPHLLRSAQ